MANKKYYWIKLKTDFFNSAEIDYLLSQENGSQYILLYQMLCLLTANNEGLLATKIDGKLIPYDVDKIVRDTKYFNRDTILVGIEWLKKLKLIYIEDSGCYKITSFDSMVGSETAKAEIMRKKRAKEKELNSGNIVTKMLPSVSERCYIEKDKEIDKELDTENREKYNIKCIDNVCKNIYLVQEETEKYNEIFKSKNIYMQNPSILPKNMKSQLKIYQLAIKTLVDIGQEELLDKINLNILQRIYKKIIKANKVDDWIEYYINILSNELAI